MIESKCRGLLGFAIKAGKAAMGMGAVEGSVRRGKAFLVLLDGRASHNTSAYVQNLCDTFDTRCVIVPSDFLGNTAGRANLTVMAITDGGFAKALRQALKAE
ncbi:MAG: hypothetical protein PHD32_06515 [Eubacteriales bacterium]|nr:hypothetical protein [Eubacteriales bacterium]